MSAQELLAKLTATGARVRIVGNQLRIKAPPGTFTPELRAAFQEQKIGLLTLLRDGPSVQPLHLLCAGCKSYFMHEPSTLCYWCRRKRDNKPLGLPCDGCGEACEECLGTPKSEMDHEGA